MITQLKFKKDARDQMAIGMNIVAEAVAATLGPKGRNVIIPARMGGTTPLSTKDGVTVSNNIRILEDPYQNAGAQIIKSVAAKTAGDAGDGTTTSTVITAYLVNKGLELIENGANPIDVKRGMDKACSLIVKEIKNRAIQIEPTGPEILNIATISANNDPAIGELIANAIGMVGNDGLISKMKSRTSETFVEKKSGLEIPSGYAHEIFITDEKNRECVLENALILMYPKKISSIHDILPAINSLLKQNEGPNTPQRSLLVVADNVDSEAASTIIINTQRGNIRACIIKTSGFGSSQLDYLEDLACMTGGRVVNEEHGDKLSAFKPEWFGTADRIIVKRDSTSMISYGGTEEQIEKRAASLRTFLTSTDINPYERSIVEKRLAKLTNGVAILHVGGNSEIEISEKMDRVDDALCACHAALSEGIVAGGGVTFITAADLARIEHINAQPGNGLVTVNQDEFNGFQLVLNCCHAPLETICANAGLNYADIFIVISTNEYNISNYGFDAKTETYGNMITEGIIDPAKVLRVSLENAVSAAGMILTTEAIIIEDNSKK